MNYICNICLPEQEKKASPPQLDLQLSNDTLFFLYNNIAFPGQAEYFYFCADFRLKIFLWIFLD